MSSCLICGQNIVCTNKGAYDAYSVNCPLCGYYDITGTAVVNLKNTELSARQKANISGWLRENPHYEITSHKIEFLTLLNTPSFHERADKLLLFLEKETEFAGEYLERADDWISHCWCINQKELIETLSFLTEVKRIRQNESLSGSTLKIDANGWEHLENIKKINAQSSQCFVAMWFTDELKKIYNEVISAGIIEAGYTPHRVDQREHNEKIDDEIIAQIKRSRFLLADFTGNRGGVYYEAGFAKGLNIEVIWSCRDDHLEDLHFDIRQYNCIVWSEKNLEEFKKRIKNRIGATIGSR